MNKLRISIIKIQTKINSRLMLKKNISKRKLREYGFFIGIVFPFFIGWLIPFLLNDSFKIWTLFISIPHILLAIFLPIQLTLFYKVWFKIGYFLGLINSSIILTIIFIFILQPISLIMRFFNYDPLVYKRKGKKTYKNKIIDSKIDLKRVF